VKGEKKKTENSVFLENKKDFYYSLFMILLQYRFLKRYFFVSLGLRVKVVRESGEGARKREEEKNQERDGVCVCQWTFHWECYSYRKRDRTDEDGTFPEHHTGAA
jgi:hypothetical protein